ncbi:MAG: Hpt domain-containing protein [Bdellovibrionales bacterium]
MKHDSPEYQQMLAELKSDYLKSLPKKIELVEQDYDRRDALALREQFHKLKGNGKTYGFESVSILADVVEKLFVDSHEKGLIATPIAISILHSIYDNEQEQKDFTLEQDARMKEILSLS